MQKTIITCDNCQRETEHPTVLKGHDICSYCMAGEFVLDPDAMSKWPRWVTTTAVIDAFKHRDQRRPEQSTITKVSTPNKHLEAEILNLPHHDPTKLIKEVKTLQNRVRRAIVSAA
jgi:hypothetical protein